jgi:methanogenic corrinoid protein MtbC1
MENKKLFTIKYVANLTGLKPPVIRAWETRYGAVSPKRTRGNRRLFCLQDVLRLKMLKRACDAGNQISQIAGSSTEELQRIVSMTGVRGSTFSADITDDEPPPPATDAYLETCLQAVIALDPVALDRHLSEAAVQLTRQAWVESLIVPLFRKIGQLWAEGRLRILNEHMATNCVRTMMWEMLRSLQHDPAAQRLVIGTPTGQMHELGALAAALATAEAGWQPVFVGTGLPSEELAAAADGFSARGVALGVTHAMDNGRAMQEIQKLRRHLGVQRHLLIKGPVNRVWDQLLERVQAHRVESWRALVRTLQTLAFP